MDTIFFNISNHIYFKDFDSNLIQIVHNGSQFYTLEVVGRGSETQLQVCKKLKLLNVAF